MAFGSISGLVESVLDSLLRGSSMVQLLSCHSRFFFMVLGTSILSYAGCNQQRESAIPDRPTRPEETVAVITPSAIVEDTARENAKEERLSQSFYTVEHYGDDRNTEEDLTRTIARARTEKKRILLQVGGEWCGWCKLLTSFIEKNDSVRSSLEKNYLLMKVTYTQKQPNEAFLSAYPKIVGYPHLFVLDDDGKLLHSQDTSPLEEGKGYSEGRILAFLEEWKRKD